MPVWDSNPASVKCLEEDFAIDVFDEKNQRKFLAPAAYKALSKLIKSNEQTLIDPELANQVASAMKTWATSRGASHWTHWFQPLTGLTAEKHDTFIGRSDMDGHPLLDLTGQELVRMEPDASSFPNGGLRGTHCARGYTVWDPLSPAFLMHYEYGATLFIPCAFVSWTKEALDNKTPLLKAEEALSYQAVKLLNAIGDNSVRVSSTLGCEQEYFILDRVKFLARPDLLCSGRTLQGAAPPKGQELDDHYFNSIPRKIVACMQDIEMQCWRLGIPITTRHNEVCPAQHEFAPVFEYTSVAVDHQNLLMGVMRAKAQEHGFEILLHEKPFAGLNGNGKHNN
jgi:glutamine synthetase